MTEGGHLNSRFFSTRHYLRSALHTSTCWEATSLWDPRGIIREDCGVQASVRIVHLASRPSAIIPNTSSMSVLPVSLLPKF